MVTCTEKVLGEGHEEGEGTVPEDISKSLLTLLLLLKINSLTFKSIHFLK